MDGEEGVVAREGMRERWAGWRKGEGRREGRRLKEGRDGRWMGEYTGEEGVATRNGVEGRKEGRRFKGGRNG